ncbi:Hypothetical protein D9617_1g080430 [Elsinoe fawcettii]|nr:Hypothetical protein D9617_1g080430 [Elsinoe fawcettii]
MTSTESSKVDQNPSTARLIISKSFDTPAKGSDWDPGTTQHKVDWQRQCNLVMKLLADGEPWYPGVPRAGSKYHKQILFAISQGLHARHAMLKYHPKVKDNEKLNKDSSWKSIAKAIPDKLTGTPLAIDGSYTAQICDLQHKMMNLPAKRIVRPTISDEGAMVWPTETQQELKWSQQKYTWANAPAAKDLPVSKSASSAGGDMEVDGESAEEKKPKGDTAIRTKARKQNKTTTKVPPKAGSEDESEPEPKATAPIGGNTGKKEVQIVKPALKATTAPKTVHKKEKIKSGLVLSDGNSPKSKINGKRDESFNAFMKDEMNASAPSGEHFRLEQNRRTQARIEQGVLVDGDWAAASAWAERRVKEKDSALVRAGLHRAYVKVDQAGGRFHPTDPETWAITLSTDQTYTADHLWNMLIFSIARSAPDQVEELVYLTAAKRFGLEHEYAAGKAAIDEAHTSPTSLRNVLTSSPTYVALLYSDRKLSLRRYLWLAERHKACMSEVMHAAHAVWLTQDDKQQYSGQEIAGKIWPKTATIGSVNRSLGYDSPILGELQHVDRVLLGAKQLDDWNEPIDPAQLVELLSRFEVRDKFFGQVKKAKPTESQDKVYWLDGGRIGPSFYDRRDPKNISKNLDILYQVCDDIKAKRFIWTRDTVLRCIDLAKYYEEAELESDEQYDSRLQHVGFALLALEASLTKAPESGYYALDPWAVLPSRVQNMWTMVCGDVIESYLSIFADQFKRTDEIMITDLKRFASLELRPKELTTGESLDVASTATLLQKGEGPTGHIPVIQTVFNKAIPPHRAPAVHNLIETLASRTLNVVAKDDMSRLITVVLNSDPYITMTHPVSHELGTIKQKAELRVLKTLGSLRDLHDELIWTKLNVKPLFDTFGTQDWVYRAHFNDNKIKEELAGLGVEREKDFTKIEKACWYVQRNVKDVPFEMQVYLRLHMPTGNEMFQRHAATAILEYLQHFEGLVFLAPFDRAIAMAVSPFDAHDKGDSEYAMSKGWGSATSVALAGAFSRLHAANLECTMDHLMEQPQTLRWCIGSDLTGSDMPKYETMVSNRSNMMTKIWDEDLSLRDRSVEYEAAKSCIAHNEEQLEEFLVIQAKVYEQFVIGQVSHDALANKEDELKAGKGAGSADVATDIDETLETTSLIATGSKRPADSSNGGLGPMKGPKRARITEIKEGTSEAGQTNSGEGNSDGTEEKNGTNANFTTAES